jgi:DNA-binding MarR family transcriptional regulator
MAKSGTSAPRGVAWDEQPLGEVPDQVLATRLDVSVQAIYAARKRRHIPACRPRRADRELARSIFQTMPTSRSDLIPIRHFVLMLYVGASTLRLQDIRDGLDMPQSTASAHVKSAEEAGRLTVVRKEGHTWVSLSPRGHREMSRRRKKRGCTPDTSSVV